MGLGPSVVLCRGQVITQPTAVLDNCQNSYYGKNQSMTWPPQSPDLNPIEMVSGELDRRVKAKGPTSAKHLWELLQDCWKTISGDDLLKLIERMPRVCKAVIRAKGGYYTAITEFITSITIC
uniref:Uncharacterized protein n=1 Tax=Denticeps clupeoides TaxID=299321 RepID=A0AAY4CNR8_9TELE